ncbi:MAG: thioredoxin family protein [Candidatus Krumholzibacteriota bacterium]|nr:thioredoxin family protein [Candidatus Krumholzibacteriota bacterium]
MLRPPRALARVLIAGLVLAAPAAALAAAEDESPLDAGGFGPPPIAVRLQPLIEPAVAGEALPLALVYSVPAGQHLTDAFLAVTFTSEPPLEFAPPVLPAGTLEEGFTVFRGEVAVWTTVHLPADLTELLLHARAEYQVCQEGEVEMCFPPGEAETSLRLAPAAAGTAWRSVALAGVTPPARLAGSPAPADAGVAGRDDAPAGGGLAGRLEGALARGSWLAFLIVFLGGILTSFTPCVYPVIPLTIGYIGGSAGGNPVKGFIMSLWFVLGIAVTYSALGLAAAATGGAFGQAVQNAWVSGAVAAVVFAMGLSMAGLFDIQISSGVASRLGGARTGWLGPLLMGFGTGLIAAPCVGPVLIVLLTWVATTGSLFLGFWLLFVFALGLGLLFIVLGTFSGAITALPGAGTWMIGVKRFFALVLFIMAFYFLGRVVPQWVTAVLTGATLVLCASAWGAFHAVPADAGARPGILKGLLLFIWLVGALNLLVGLAEGFAPDLLPRGGGSAAVAPAAEPEWIWNDEDGFARARQAGTPVMMDFWAEWCAACKELDHETYNQPEVLALASRFTSIKMDMTARNDANRALLDRYQVHGMPTVIFFDSDGRELERFSGFVDAATLAPVMERVLAADTPDD